MTEQLVAELAGMDPGEVEWAAGLLRVAGAEALAAGDPCALLYEALSASLGRPGPGMDPLLTGAVLSAEEADPGSVGAVQAELLSMVGPDQEGLPAALARELACAYLDAGCQLREARAELAGWDGDTP